MKCEICFLVAKNKTGFSNHLLRTHKITPEEYTLKYLLGGVHPLCCCGCKQKTKYADKQYRFNVVVHNHHKPTLGKKMLEETKKKISYKRRQLVENNPEKLPRLSLEEIQKRIKNKGYLLISDISEYQNNRTILSFKCKKHLYQFQSCMEWISKEYNQCVRCREYGTSKGEKEIREYVKSMNIIVQPEDKSNKEQINPLELDIFVPEKNIAIEHNGIYYHSEKYVEKNYHFNKFQLCKNKNIKLLQFFEDEWRDKQDICKSIIKNRLGLIINKLFARKLKLIESDKKNNFIFKDFFKENHLQGNTVFTKAFGLINENGDLQIAISVRKPFTKKENCIEIARLASKIDTVVVGGCFRLLKKCLKWCKENGIKKIITYSDCRYSWGETYQKYGFTFVGHTGIGYDYTYGQQRFGRFRFRAQNGKSEKQVAEENKVYKIYNAGNFRWELNI